MKKKKKIVILGSTGSIGSQSLEVLSKNTGHFELSAIVAGNNAALLAEQALKYNPEYAVINNIAGFKKLSEVLAGTHIKIMAGPEAIKEVVSLPDVDMVMASMVGFAGLEPTIAAIKAGKDIALANKETMVVAGELITSLAKKHKVRIIPVDSEHSAIFQCLTGEDPASVEKLILTASGGPFRGMNISHLEKVTVKDALRHPNWCMGKKVTIDSASLMNKGLEVIEARWLFDIPSSDIEVIIHPQSVIHSMVRFHDGSIKAQLGVPDMRLPIQYALSYPKRLDTSYLNFSFRLYPNLTFEQPDISVFRSLDLAYQAMKKGGNMPCIMNAANEVAVEAFLKEKIRFTRIPDIIETAMSRITYIEHPVYEEYCLTHENAKGFTERYINS